MADEALAGLDEGALRKLLEVTADLAERRRIRAAIRELQRQELEREEEALASKRFRAERQDNKENWLNSQQREAELRAALSRLARRLESMSDVEELTVLLRSAGEYEERKLIRAAIRRVRAQELEAATTLAGRLFGGHEERGSAEDGPGRVAPRSGQQQVPEPEEREPPAEAPEPTPSSRVASQGDTTVTLLLQALPEGSPTPQASPTASPEPPPETPPPSPKPRPDLPGTPSPEPQEPPVPPSAEGQAVHEPPPGPTEPPAPQGSTGTPAHPRRTESTPLGRGPAPVQHTGGSVQDRVRKLTADSPRPEELRGGSARAAPGPSLASTSTSSRGHSSSSSSSSSRDRDTSSQPGREKPAAARPLAQLQSSPREEGPRGRGLATRSLENRAGGPVPRTQAPSILPPASTAVGSSEPGDSMKTTVTIEIKGGRGQASPAHVLLPTGSQRAELTLGLRAPPSLLGTSGTGKGTITHISTPGAPAPGRLGSATHFTSISHATPGNRAGRSIKMELEPAEPASAALQGPGHPEQTPGNEAPEGRSPLNAEQLMAIEDEGVLDKMLDQATDFEERKLIRAALRELRQRKRDQRDKERERRLQEVRARPGDSRAGNTATTETTTRHSQRAPDGSIRTVTKTERLVHSSDGTRTARTTTVESSFTRHSENGGGSTMVQTKTFSSTSSSSSKKTGSIFDREDETSPRPGSLAALEKRQAEKKKELMKAQSLPKTSASQARKAMIEKLEKEGPACPGSPRTAVQRSTSFGVPNANSIKQMLLDWCRAKTRGYEHVDIQNFSSSWSDGMAFCALVHNFFPEAFDYGQLSPQNRRHNFEVAFSSAETHADCPQLLDTDDMVRLREPDWKCVYTYLQEFYRCLVQKGLVKTKKS